MSTFPRVLLLCLALGWIGCPPALAAKRVALVVGNSAYQNAPILPNPVNDAHALADMLKAAGFDTVDARLNLSAEDMRRELLDFGIKSRDADLAVVYYAGHGVELDGVDYLIPVDAVLHAEADVPDRTVSLDRVLLAVEPAKQRLIILDANRDNPFAHTARGANRARLFARGPARLLATPNTMIAFAAGAGSVAEDGEKGKDSPFADALVRFLPQPGLDLRKAFGLVCEDVLKNTGSRQAPEIYESFGGDDAILVPAVDEQLTRHEDVRRDYELAVHLGTREGWNAFLSRYPVGFYSDLARLQLSKLTP